MAESLKQHSSVRGRVLEEGIEGGERVSSVFSTLRGACEASKHVPARQVWAQVTDLGSLGGHMFEAWERLRLPKKKILKIIGLKKKILNEHT